MSFGVDIDAAEPQKLYHADGTPLCVNNDVVMPGSYGPGSPSWERAAARWRLIDLDDRRVRVPVGMIAFFSILLGTLAGVAAYALLKAGLL